MLSDYYELLNLTHREINMCLQLISFRTLLKFSFCAYILPLNELEAACRDFSVFVGLFFSSITCTLFVFKSKRNLKKLSNPLESAGLWPAIRGAGCAFVQ